MAASPAAATDFVVGHITPEAQDGGLLALAKSGDTITIDAETNASSHSR